MLNVRWSNVILALMLSVTPDDMLVEPEPDIVALDQVIPFSTDSEPAPVSVPPGRLSVPTFTTVLTVTLPQREEARAKQISISAE